MAWTIEFAPAAGRDLEKVDGTVRKRILKSLYTRVARLDDPRAIGEALRGQRLGEFWKYRVGAYRILCQIEDAKIRVVVARLGHRREVYD